MHLMHGEVYMACMWPLFWQIGRPDDQPYPDRSVFRPEAPHSTTPTYEALHVMQHVMGGKHHFIDTTEPKVTGLASSFAQENKVEVILINKRNGVSDVSIETAPFPSNWNLVNHQVYDGLNGTRYLVETGVVRSEKAVLLLPPYSLNRLTFKPN